MSVSTAYMSRDGVIVDDSTYSSLAEKLKFLGAGISRRVYALDSETVLKIENARYSECNLKERDTWEELQHTEVAHMLAPVIACSPSGGWLVMARGERTVYEDHGLNTPDEYQTVRHALRPYGATDLHEQNAMYFSDGSIKVVDYGFFGDRGFGANDNETCHCNECRIEASDMRHAEFSCAHRTSRNHGKCYRCSVSACKTVNHVVQRDTRYCQANGRSTCGGRLAGYWQSPSGTVHILCGHHLPVIGPVWSDYTHPEMFIHVNDGRELIRFGIMR